MKPDEIILWLAEEQFNGIDSLPKALLEQQKRGLTIRFCDDLRSHKKYYYTMQEYPRDIVILVDDDMFYPKDTIKKLWKLHKKYPNDICSITTQIIVLPLIEAIHLEKPFLRENRTFKQSSDFYRKWVFICARFT